MGAPVVSAIRAPTPDIANHQIVLTQLKEETELGRRIRGEPSNSFVTLGELISIGLVKYIGQVLSPGNKAAGGGLSTVSVTDSITGNGSVGSPLKLIGDTASPTASQYYGTNAGSTRGWYNLPGGGGSLTVTDGTHSVAGTTSITFSGATVGGTTPNATVTISGGGSTPIPGTIPDLTFWWESDNILATAGAVINRLQERTPWIGGLAASNLNSAVVVDATLLNSLPVLTWPAALASGNYVMPTGFFLSGGCSIFIVAKGTVGGATQAIFGGSGTVIGATGAACLYIGVGTPAIALVSGGLAVVGTCATAWTPGVFFQANVTYNASTGAFIFRQARAAANSGTGATGAGTTDYVGAFGQDNTGGGSAKLNAASLAAVIIYNRVLTPTEVITVENYLHAKWGV